MNVAWTRAAEGLPRRAFTAEDLRRMIDVGIISEDERIELIEGEFVVIAAKGYAHEFVRLALVELLTDARPKGIRVASEPTLQFADNTVVEPDIAVFPRTAVMRSNADFIRLRGEAILLLVEVAVTNLRGDKTRKAPMYARQGIQELWVVDANKRVATVHRGPTPDGWSFTADIGPEDTLTTPAFPGLTIKLGELE